VSFCNPSCISAPWQKSRDGPHYHERSTKIKSRKSKKSKFCCLASTCTPHRFAPFISFTILCFESYLLVPYSLFPSSLADISPIRTHLRPTEPQSSVTFFRKPCTSSTLRARSQRLVILQAADLTCPLKKNTKKNPPLQVLF